MSTDSESTKVSAQERLGDELTDSEGGDIEMREDSELQLCPELRERHCQKLKKKNTQRLENLTENGSGAKCNCTKHLVQKKVYEQKNLQPPGIEPGSPAWKADIIPLDHGCYRDSRQSCGLISVGSVGHCALHNSLFTTMKASHIEGI